MMTTITSRVRSRVAVLLSAAAIVAAGAAPSGAVAPTSSDIEWMAAVMWSLPDLRDASFGSDVIVGLASGSGGQVHVYRQDLLVSEELTALGATTFVGRAARASSVAEHDGSIAYARAVDGRLVVQAPDGVETLPAWDATTHSVAHGGVSDLTADWLVADTSGLWPRVFALATGAELDLAALTPTTRGVTDVRIDSVALGADAVLWTATGSGPDAALAGVYVVGIDSAGPVGEVATLETAECSASPCPVLRAVTTVDGAVAWSSSGPTGREVRWFPAPPYTGDPTGLQVGAGMRVVRGSGAELAIAGPPVADESSVTWYDLASASATPTRTATIPGALAATSGSLVILRSPPEGGNLWFADAGGGAIAGSDLPVPRAPEFSDVVPRESAPDGFADEILWLADRGVVGGYPDGTFRGLAAINRDALAAFLYRAVHDGADAPSCGVAPFNDVPVSHPFCGEIAWLASTGATTGWPDGTFRPASAVTREAMAAFLYRLAHDGVDAPVCTSAPFVDVSVANPFCGAVAWLAETGVTTGWPDGTFRPALSIERQAMAAFLYRAIAAGLTTG